MIRAIIRGIMPQGMQLCHAAQVADQFRRMWALYCSLLRWRVWLKQQRWHAAQHELEERRRAADAVVSALQHIMHRAG
jgi:hypothetical protein